MQKTPTYSVTYGIIPYPAPCANTRVPNELSRPNDLGDRLTRRTKSSDRDTTPFAWKEAAISTHSRCPVRRAKAGDAFTSSRFAVDLRLVEAPIGSENIGNVNWSNG